MKLKIITSVVMCLMAATGTNAQSLERLVVGSAGSSGTGANVTVDYTIGEVLIQTVSSSSNILTQGFHQPVSGGVSIQDIAAFTYSVFPNPFTDAVQVELTTENTSSVQIQLTDLYGRVIYTETKNDLPTGNHTLPLNTQNFSGGTYVLTITVKEDTGKLAASASKQLNLIR